MVEISILILDFVVLLIVIFMPEIFYKEKTMDFYIHGIREVVQTVYKLRIHSMAIISITQPNEPDVNFSSAMISGDKILRLQFNDVDRQGETYKVFTVNDAKNILKFVDKYIRSVDFFIVHCHAGVSRSAGVAAALSKIYNNTDKYIFNCKKYNPNMKVYTTILNEYYK